MDALYKYMERTGASKQEALGGLAFYGFDKVLELLAEANEKNMKLIFFYATKQDREADKPSYRFE